MNEDVCRNTGLGPLDCNCLDCIPSFHRFKSLGLEAECKTIEDIIDAIHAEIYGEHNRETQDKDNRDAKASDKGHSRRGDDRLRLAVP